MNDLPPKRYIRFRQFRILAIFLLTGLIAIPVAIVTNGKSAFERDLRTIQEISDQLTIPFGWSTDEHDSFGVMAMETFSVEWEPTIFGKLSGISFHKRASAIHLHSDECAAKIPHATTRLDLSMLILRGEFDETDVAAFRNSKPGVEVISMD